MPRWLDEVARRARGYLDRAREGPDTYVLRGCKVVVTNPRPDIETPFVLERLDAALGLIEHHQPWRLAHIRRDLRAIVVAPFPCRGAYFPGQRTVLTELSFLARSVEFTPAQVAASVVHEGVHARVHRMGQHLGFHSIARDAPREERLCRRAELAFGQALPPQMGAPVIARAMQSLELADEEVAPSVDWAAAHAVKRQADASAVEAWRQRGERS
jgi:hypothetical protein